MTLAEYMLHAQALACYLSACNKNQRNLQDLTDCEEELFKIKMHVRARFHNQYSSLFLVTR